MSRLVIAEKPSAPLCWGLRTERTATWKAAVIW